MEEHVAHMRARVVAAEVPGGEKTVTLESRAGKRSKVAIAQKILDRQNGLIWVTSEPGNGSTFFVALPAVPNTYLPSLSKDAQSSA